MSNSKRINYSLRPAKHVERKMLLECFRKLSEFGRLEDYRYIGFGAEYFSDFYLFHKALDIRKMYSIERNTEDRRRYLFNRPYACIRVKFGTSLDLLPLFEWEDEKTILWLDYTDRLNANILADISHFCTYATSGSIIIVTVNAQPDTFPRGTDVKKVKETREASLKKLRDEVGAELVSPQLRGDDLRKWGTALEYRRIVNRHIASTLRDRNGVLPLEQQMQYRQLFHYNYADGTQMVTIGGILYDQRDLQLVEKCSFDKIWHLRDGDEPYHIRIPSLTYRELRFLDRCLPNRDIKKLKRLGIPEDDLDKYAELYRYFPVFSETEF